MMEILVVIWKILVQEALNLQQLVWMRLSVTMYASATDIDSGTGRVDEVTGNVVGAGKAVGVMRSVGIDETGKVVASYSNGDTKVIGQIAITTFANPTGLEKKLVKTYIQQH